MKTNNTRVQPFKSFDSPVYRIFFISLIGDTMAMNMQIMARSLLIYRMTGSATILGAVSFAQSVPMLLFTLFGGVIADRVQKRSILIVGNILSVGLSLFIALFLTFGYLSAEHAGSWWILAVTSVAQGTIMALTMPSRQSIIPEIVGTELLMNATSLRVMGMNMSRIFGPALTGFLIDAFGFAAIFFVMAVLYALSASFLFCFMQDTNSMAMRNIGAMKDVKEGIKYLQSETLLLFILCFSLLAAILTIPYQTLLPIFAEDIFQVGAAGLGMMISVFGVGAIIGSVVLASLQNKQRGLLMLYSGLLLGLVLAAFSFSTSWYVALVFIGFVGLTHTARVTLANTLIQYYADRDFIGRVMSIHMMEFGLMGIGTFIAGLLTDVVGVQWILGGFGLILAIVSILALIAVPRIRMLD